MKRKLKSLFLTICLLATFVASSVSEVSAAAIGNRDWKWPVPSSNTLSSCFGDGREHYAIDITGAKGADVVAAYSGKVITAYNSGCTHSDACDCGGGLGNYVEIEHTYKGVTYVSRYGHLNSISVSVNQTVTAGKVIGTVGTTGYSFGYHLDFQIYQKSPKVYIDPLKDQFLEYKSGLNANGATTACCYTYVEEVKEIYSGAASDELSITGYNYPTTIKKGGVFSITGTVSSGSSKITSLTVGVYNSAGTLKTGKTVSPNATSYNVANVDDYIAFNTLDAGTYKYRITATNSSGTKILLDKEFTVTDITDNLSITGYNYPTTIPKGGVFSITGTISSQSSKITSLTVGVYDSAGTLKTGRTVSPNTTSYNVANVDDYIAFNILDAGTYKYRITATNSSGTKILLDKEFTVTDITDNLSITGYNYPTTIPKGGVFSITGTISSQSSKITSLTVGVYDSAGTLKTGRTVNPNATSYNVANVDDYIEFNILDAGTYKYKITATNSAGTKILLEKEFTVY